MFKVLGAAVIISASFLYSRVVCREMLHKIEIADGLIAGFSALEEQACVLFVPMSEAIKATAPIFGEVGEVLSREACRFCEVTELFSEAFLEYAEFSSAVLPYVGGITAVGADERRGAFAVIKARLEDKRSTLSIEYSRLGRLYNAVGIPVGVLIAILLY